MAIAPGTPLLRHLRAELANVADPRKAPLRQYAKTDPEVVARYMGENEAALSGLSRREAVRQIERRRTQ